MTAIEIFKTDIKGKRNASFLLSEMKEVFPGHSITLDLDDHDKVLRVENKKGNVNSGKVIELLEKRNFRCEILNY